MIAALAPGLIAFGSCLVILPLLKRNSTIARSLMAGISLVLSVRYFVWRVTQTLPPPGFTADCLVGYPFVLAEGASLVAVCLSLLFLSRTIKSLCRREGWNKEGCRRCAGSTHRRVHLHV